MWTTTTTNSGDQSSDEPNVKLFLDSSSSGEDDFVVTYKKRRPVPRRTERLANFNLGSSARVQHEGNLDDESFDDAGTRRVASKTREEEARKPVPPRPPPARSSDGAWFLPGFPNSTQQQDPLSEDAKQKRKRSTNAKRKEEPPTLRAAAGGGSGRRVREGTRKDPSSARRKAKANVQSGDRPRQVDTNTARHMEEESFSPDGFSGAASAGLFAGVFGSRRNREISKKGPAPMVVDSVGERTKPPSVSPSIPALRDESTLKSSWEWPVVTTAISQPLPSEDESKEQETMKKSKGPRVESKKFGSERGSSRKKPVAFKAADVAETDAALKSTSDDDDEPSDDSAGGNVKSVTGESTRKASNSAFNSSL